MDGSPLTLKEAVIITELEKRMEQYLQSEDFQMDIGALVNDISPRGFQSHQRNSSGRKLLPKLVNV